MRIVHQSRPWGDEASAAAVRRTIRDRVGELGGFMGSGDLDLPGSLNWYAPDIAVAPKELTKGDGPHPFGAALRLPEPFGIELDTSEL
ncbi:hypothetical protein [Streptomyces sp. NPDC096339]|uniref:hypothetical protein n=1 Tax=Streptomyces sp. NPDC096339 TaxID=3366086 RepID=UPI0037F4F80E